jgi:hypothetical protein
MLGQEGVAQVRVRQEAKWWAETGLNRRHQDFQSSPPIAYIACVLNHFLSHTSAVDVVLSGGQLQPVARCE